MTRLTRCAASLAGLLFWAGVAGAQSTHEHGEHAAHGDVSTDSAAHASTDAAMTGALRDGRHMRLSPTRIPTAADSTRADSIVSVLRGAIAKYRDVRLAEADGFRLFAPGAKQRVDHFTKWGNAVRARFGFDATRPTSLLYTKDDDGRFVLVGAMFTAPAKSSDAELDARVPRGIARWHLHTDICVPLRPRDRAAWARTANGVPVFGPASPIATEAECRAAGGQFRERVLNWMVHVNVFSADVWSEHML